MIAPENQRDRPFLAVDQQGFERILRLHAKELAESLDCPDAGRCHGLEGLCRLGAFTLGPEGGGSLDIRGVVVLVAIGNRILAGICKNVKLL